MGLERMVEREREIEATGRNGGGEAIMATGFSSSADLGSGFSVI